MPKVVTTSCPEHEGCVLRVSVQDGKDVVRHITENVDIKTSKAVVDLEVVQRLVQAVEGTISGLEQRVAALADRVGELREEVSSRFQAQAGDVEAALGAARRAEAIAAAVENKHRDLTGALNARMQVVEEAYGAATQELTPRFATLTADIAALRGELARARLTDAVNFEAFQAAVASFEPIPDAVVARDDARLAAVEKALAAVEAAMEVGDIARAQRLESAVETAKRTEASTVLSEERLRNLTVALTAKVQEAQDQAVAAARAVTPRLDNIDSAVVRLRVQADQDRTNLDQRMSTIEARQAQEG